jgi:uncharacterized protein YcbK (DUF882 family)
MSRLSQHFSTDEFRCKDGCGLLVVKPLLVSRLEELRQRLGKPIRIVSGFRCCQHNAAVKGASRSRHTVGEAADIPAALGVTEQVARAIGFTGIGMRGKTVVHVDVRPQRHVTTWQY